MTAARPFPAASEDQIHRSVAAFLRLRFPNLLWAHPPNGGSRNEVEAFKLKRMGVMPGLPDLIVFLPGGKVGLMEIKSAKGRLSDAQKAFLDRAEGLGVPWAVVRSIDDVAETLSGWGVK